MTDILRELFFKQVGSTPKTIQPISAEGSNRRYYRICDDNNSLIGTIGTSVEENEAFFVLSDHLCQKGINVPIVHAVSDDRLSYLQSDFGDKNLYSMMGDARKRGEFSSTELVLLNEAISALPDIQFKGAENFDFNNCYPIPEFDKQSIFWDLNYFKYCFLKLINIDFSENELEKDFEKLCSILLFEKSDTFMYRDFQSRNVMWNGDKPCFIDFQGGRKGPIYYDVASFIWQSRACYTSPAKESMLDAYLNSLSRYVKIEKSLFVDKLRYFLLFRLLQNLGAYGYRGLYEKKTKFLTVIPQAFSHLNELLEESFSEIPYLDTLLRKITSTQRFNTTNQDELVIDVMSFSFHKGIPDDFSGNGGGFVFDCRAIHNPGRYEPYKKLSGIDVPVIEFLENDGEIVKYLDSVYKLVDPMVETYKQRGFKHIQICFGCTGGQHRSVYSAENCAKHIFGIYSVKVNVTHKNLGISYTLDSLNKKQ